MGEAKRKLARDAGDDLNAIPGTHGPASAKSQHIMVAIMQTVKEVYPDCDCSIFVFEKAPAGSDRNDRYNYASTVDRADMNAVLRAFLARQDEMARIDGAISKLAEGSA
jgi:hypothetical protein